MHTGNKSKQPRVSVARESELTDLADCVIEAHCENDRIEPDRIVRAKGIELIYDRYENAFDGLIECMGDRFYIHCNLDRENLPGSPRGRFTLAHELGHYFIDEHRNSLLSGTVKPHPSLTDSIDRNLYIEREADFFASRLLMPESRFRSAIRKATLGLPGVVSIADQFAVSISCAAIRVVTSETFPCAVIKWSRNGFCWKWCSRAFWTMGYRKTITTLQRVPELAATKLALNGADASKGVIQTGTTASFWFPAVGLKHPRNIPLMEQSLSLGKHGAITLLVPLKGCFPKELEAFRDYELETDEYRLGD